MSLSGTAARGAATTLAGQWLKFLIQTTALVLLARLLRPGDFGLFAMVMAFVGIALLFGDFGLSMASIQAESISHEQRSNLFWINLLIGFVCASTIFALAVPVANFYDRPELVPVTHVLALVFLLQSATAQFSADASRRFRFTLLAWTDISAQAGALAVALSVALLGYGYWSLVWQQVTAAAISLIILASTSRWWPGLPRQHIPMRSLLAFGSQTMGVQAVNYVSANVDSVLLGRFWGASELGIYDRAYQLFRIPLQQIAAPMTRVALPILSRIKDPLQFDEYIGRAQLVLTYALGGAFAIAVAVSNPLFALALGPGWGQAPKLFSILAVGGLFQVMGYVYYWIFLAKGKTGLQLRFSVIARVLMVLLIFIGVKWAAEGVAVAVSAGLFLNWLMLTGWAVPRTGVRVSGLVRQSAVPIGVYALMVGVALNVSHLLKGKLSDVLLLVALLATCASTLFLVWLVSRRVRRDVELLIVTARKGLRRG